MLLLPEFDYEKPKSLEQTIALLQQKKRNPKVLAGGTDLLVQMKEGLFSYGLLVDIKAVPELIKIEADKNGALSFGAAVTMTELIDWIRSHPGYWSGLVLGADSVGSPQIRNRATVVGNICRASPSADTVPGLIALDAIVKISGTKGERSITLGEFITGPGQTALSGDEIVVSISLPKPAGPTELVYIKQGMRRAMDLAAVSVAVRLTANSSKSAIVTARIVLGAVAPTPLRLEEGEALLVEEGIGTDVLEKLGRMACERSQPISDVRASADYRYETVQVLTKRATTEAWRRLKDGEN
jgi:carbon-monoxide dehydrogenase medium subunit